jgi:hypothetical protein
LKAYAKLRVADAGQIAVDYGSITPNASVAMVTLAKTCFKLARDIETHVGDLKDQAHKNSVQTAGTRRLMGYES